VQAELTKPEVSQSIILTRVSGRASAVPELESIAKLAEHRATMCIFLSGPHLKKIVADLLLHYPDETPVTLVYRASWPEQKTYQGTLGTILAETKRGAWNLTTMMLVGAALDRNRQVESSLYSKDFTHLFRVVKKRSAKSKKAAAEVDAVEAGIDTEIYESGPEEQHSAAQASEKETL
jgi:precorrin-4/cobalt-precorrin-4 C11-methyltransferase